jgi:FMN phosphatase YigB (HAD superfamily)
MQTQAISEETAVISFDLWKTLIVPHPDYRAEWTQVLFAALQSPMDIDTFSQIVAVQELRANALSQITGHDVSFQTLLNAIAAQAAGKTADEDQLDELYGRMIDMLHRHPPVLIDPDAPVTLLQLSERFRLVLSSNNGYMNRADLENILDFVGLLPHMPVRVYSSDVGHTKPDGRFFQAVCSATNAKPHEITHVSNNVQADVHGAEHAGLRAIYYFNGAPLADTLGLF